MSRDAPAYRGWRDSRPGGARRGSLVPAGGGGGAAFNPLSPGFTWHSAYWAADPDWSDPGDGGLVDSWRNAGENASTLTASGGLRPTYDAENVNWPAGVPTILFSGSQHMSVTFAGGAISQPNTIVVVGRRINSNNMYFVDGTGSSNRHSLFKGTTSGWSFFAGGATVTVGTAGIVPVVLAGVFHDGGSPSARVNGAELSTTSSGTHTLLGIRAGSNSSTSQLLSGEINFIGIYDGNLKTDFPTELAALEAWFVDYAIP